MKTAIPEGLIEKVAECTDENFHTESLILIAKALDDNKTVALLEEIEKQHLDIGYLTAELSEDRYVIYTGLKIQVMEKFENGNELLKAL